MRQQYLLRRLQIRHSPSQLQNSIVSPSTQPKLRYRSHQQILNLGIDWTELLYLLALHVGVAVQLGSFKPCFLDQSGLHHTVSHLFRCLSGGFLVQEIVLMQSWDFYIDVDAIE